MDATLEIKLDADFLAAAEAAEKPPADIVVGLMREFVERERAAYEAFLHQKVVRAQKTADEGGWRPNEEVERHFAERKHKLAEPLHSPAK